MQVVIYVTPLGYGFKAVGQIHLFMSLFYSHPGQVYHQVCLIDGRLIWDRNGQGMGPRAGMNNILVKYAIVLLKDL